MQFHQIILVLVMGVILACKPEGDQSNTTDTPPPATQPNPSGLTNAAGGQGQGQPNAAALTGTRFEGLGSIQVEVMHELYYNCNSMDVIFYDTKFSLSQTDTNSIRTTLEYLLPSPVVHDINCKPIGRVTFWIDGEFGREADIYVGPTCNYWIWIENEKPAYINPMTPRGIQFFTNIINKGHELVPKQ
jgi:hypothetical protein